jgi:hypothetical protein
VGSWALMGPTEEPLDGGVSTHRWACTPAREPVVAPFVFLQSLIDLVGAAQWKKRAGKEWG